MLVKLSLKNSTDHVLVDDHVYEYLTTNERLKNMDFVYNLRLHSGGYAYFQKTWKQKDGGYKTETIYLHRLIGDKFLDKPNGVNKPCMSIKNGNRLDFRLSNLEWLSRGDLQRHNNRTGNSTGFKGVHKENNRFVAKIYLENQKYLRIGVYESPEDAALAYNKKSIELFGPTRGLNKLKGIDGVEGGHI